MALSPGWGWKLATIVLAVVVLVLGWWQWETHKWLRDDLLRGWINAHGFVYSDPPTSDPTKPPPPPPEF